MKDFVGYDTVVMNWLISLYGGRGFLYGVQSDELFNLNYAAEFVESTEASISRFALAYPRVCTLESLRGSRVTRIWTVK